LPVDLLTKASQLSADICKFFPEVADLFVPISRNRRLEVPRIEVENGSDFLAAEVRRLASLLIRGVGAEGQMEPRGDALLGEVPSPLLLTTV